MLKTIFPVIFLLALEIAPMVKSYSAIHLKYGDHLQGLMPQLPVDSNAAMEGLTSKLDELQKGGESEKNTQLEYVF